MNKTIKYKRERNKYNWRRTPNKTRFINKELKTKLICLNLIVDELIKLGYEKQLANNLVQHSTFNHIYNEYTLKQDIISLAMLHHDFYPEDEALELIKNPK